MTELSTGFDLDTFLAAERPRVEEALGRALDRLVPTLPSRLLPVVRHGVLTGGKRLRPILCVAAYRACGGAESPSAYDLAASLEMIHAYSLMHDDLPCMDDADLRRGRPAPHTAYGEAATAVAGASLIPAAAAQAFEAAGRLGCDDSLGAEIVRELARAAGGGGMVGGQAVDLDAEGRSISQTELDALHGMKTGALLAASLRIGALVARAPKEAVDALYGYGRSIGLAFQITDDVLDATASAAELGKNPSDEQLDKSTYVALHGLEEARKLATDEVGRALRQLSAAGLSDPALLALAQYVVERQR